LIFLTDKAGIVPVENTNKINGLGVLCMFKYNELGTF
jgi:hypothetical protein